jgi:pimeloyl-ACP methyl ester carboxylesterase
LPPPPAAEYDSPTVRATNRDERARHRARWRRAWWLPPAAFGLFFCCLWGLLRVDQYVADRFFWPSSGAQFVEVGPVPADPESTGGTIVVVTGGLNRKSGTGPALALMPALSAEHARVFSLVYGNGISDNDVEDKFTGLIDRVRPDRVDFFGSSMGGDVALRLAAHLQRIRSDSDDPDSAGNADVRPAGLRPDSRPLPAQVRAARSEMPGAPTGFARWTTPSAPAAGADRRTPPRLGVIYLDCTPLGATDARDVGRTRADAVTALSEALHTDGGVGVRMLAEVLGQQPQWSTGVFPFLDIRWPDLTYKVDQVWREKIAGPGVSTQLVKDQYGVIRRMDIGAVAADLGPGARIVYFRPEVARDDRVVRVGAAEATLRDLARDLGLDVRIAPIPGGHHAAAESNAPAYLWVFESVRASHPS